MRIVILALMFVTLLVLGNRHFGWLHRFQEWRYERQMDETYEWQEFNDAFKVEK
jgi:hypothetical protein